MAFVEVLRNHRPTLAHRCQLQPCAWMLAVDSPSLLEENNGELTHEDVAETPAVRRAPACMA